MLTMEAPELPVGAARVRHLLEGSFLQVLPGMGLTEGGVEHCRPGDVGTVFGYCQGGSPEASVIVDSDVSISVQWTRTQRCSVVPRSSWVWFRFIRTPEPCVGDFLQALPGADFVDESGVEHYRVGDVGEAVGISNSAGSRNFRIKWPRSGKVSEIAQTSWTWFRVFRPHGAATNVSSTAHIDDLIAKGAEDTCFSVLWIRPGQTTKEPKVGDSIQLLAGAGFVDPSGTSYREGDVGKVANSDGSIEGSGVSSATITWTRTGQTSIISREAMHSFQFFRMQEPRIGDLMVAAPGIRYADANGVEHYAGGDSGSVVSVLHIGAIDGSLRICWGRTGEVTECALTSWSAHFSLVPLQSNVPSYIRYPFGDMEDRV